MYPVRRLTPLAVILLLSACATLPEADPTFTVVPGQGKALAAFQQDDVVCRRHAVSHTGYGDPAPAGATGSAEPPSADMITDDTAYLQCMAARGNTVYVQPAPNFAAVDAYDYPYGYGYPGPLYDGGLYAGFGWGGWYHHGWRHGGWHNGGWHHGFAGRGGAGRGGGGGRGSGGGHH